MGRLFVPESTIVTTGANFIAGPLIFDFGGPSVVEAKLTVLNANPDGEEWGFEEEGKIAVAKNELAVSDVASFSRSGTASIFNVLAYEEWVPGHDNTFLSCVLVTPQYLRMGAAITTGAVEALYAGGKHPKATLLFDIRVG